MKGRRVAEIIMDWVNNRLENCTPRSVQNLVMFRICIIDLSECPESSLIKFEDTAKTGEAASILEHRMRIQNVMLQKTSGKCRMQFKGNFASVLCLGRNNQLQKYRAEATTRWKVGVGAKVL